VDRRRAPAVRFNTTGERRYRYLRQLGHGSHGEIWLVFDRFAERNVALKRVRASSPIALLRFKREFRVMAPLQHRHLVRLIELTEDEGGPFFTMEFVEGEDLRSLLERKVSSLGLGKRCGLARELARQILPTLGFLHERGIVHCDVKPSNLLLGVDGVIKLGDFGSLAQLRGSTTRSLDDGTAGTPRYMAPERLSKQPAVPASDLYSLGLVLFEILAGRRPAEPREEDGERSAGASFPRFDEMLPGVPRDLANLGEALLRPNPQHRQDAGHAILMLGADVTPPPDRSSSVRKVPFSNTRRRDILGWVALRLESVRDGLFGSCIFEGPRASGKTAALAWTHEFIRGFGGFLLPARGRPDERTRYNVLDGAVDVLAGALLEIPLDAELARDVRIASAAFPVLAGAQAQSAARSRDDALEGLFRIVDSMAGRDGIYISIDDLHFADADSLEVLDRFLQRQPAGVGLLGTVRTDFENPAVLRWLEGRPKIERKKLGSESGATL